MLTAIPPHTDPSLWLFFFYCYGDHRDLHSFPTRRSSDLRGSLRLELSLPRGTLRTVLTLRAPQLRRRVAVVPRRRITVVVPVSGRGPWTLHFRTPRPGYLTDGRDISVQAETPVFTPSR